MLDVTGKQINLVQLQDELAAANINLPRGLGKSGPSRDDPKVYLHTFNQQGSPADLPSDAEVVVTAHVPQPSEQEAAKTDLVSQYNAATARLDDIVSAGPGYTAAQTRDAVIDLARILRRMLRLQKANA